MEDVNVVTPEIDYNYHNDPAFIERVIEKHGGIGTFLTFCQLNQVEIYRGGDYMYGLLVNREQGTWSTELDGFSALIMGVVNYKKHNTVAP